MLLAGSAKDDLATIGRPAREAKVGGTVGENLEPGSIAIHHGDIGHGGTERGLKETLQAQTRRDRRTATRPGRARFVAARKKTDCCDPSAFITKMFFESIAPGPSFDSSRSPEGRRPGTCRCARGGTAGPCCASAGTAATRARRRGETPSAPIRRPTRHSNFAARTRLTRRRTRGRPRGRRSRRHPIAVKNRGDHFSPGPVVSTWRSLVARSIVAIWVVPRSR